MNYETRITGENIDIQPDSSFSDEAEASSKKRLWLIIAAVILAAAAGIGWFAFNQGGETATAEGGAAGPADDSASQAPTVTVIVPGSNTVERTINSTGTFAARREMPIGIPGEGGQVTRVLVEPGQWVRRGQTLAVIDRSVAVQQLRSQGANIKVAQADADLAQAELDRAQALVERGFISKADIDRRTATRDSAVARVAVARAQYNELAARGRRLDITAPESGLILERNVAPGQVVSAGSGVLFRMAAGGEMELRAQLSETDLARLSDGVSANVTPVGASKSFTGQVWQISPVINPQSRQGTARIALPYDPAIRPGGFGNATIISGAAISPVLPESAVQSDNDGAYVYIVNAENKVERRDIQTGQVTANGITINDGLNGTEQVVLYAAGFLNPGETVNTRLDGEDAPEKTKTTGKGAGKDTGKDSADTA